MGKSGAAIVKAKDAAYAAKMQDHEERNDLSGARRSVRELQPFVYSPYAQPSAPDPFTKTRSKRATDKDTRILQILSLIEEKPEGREFSIMDACNAHVAGARKNSSAKKELLHGFFQFPTDFKVTEKNQKLMLAIAVDFVDRTYGGNAVIHARIDRDEKGQHGVDVFFAPRYEKHTNLNGTEQWVSLSKFSKENARERLGKRHKHLKNKKTKKFEPVFDKEGKPVMVWNDADVFQGSALQDAWFEHLQENVGEKYDVERGMRKMTRGPDRLEPEDYALVQEEKKLRAEVKRQLGTEDSTADVESVHTDVASKLIAAAGEQALTEARAASENIVEAAFAEATRVVVGAQESAATDVTAIRKAMLNNEGNDYIEMKEELSTLRQEVLRMGRIIEIWNEIIQRLLPTKMRQMLKSAFDAAWKKGRNTGEPSIGPDI